MGFFEVQQLGDIRLGNLVFNSRDENGCVWTVSDIEGWWELPEPQTADEPRPYVLDGSYFIPGRYGPRNIVLRGHIVPQPGSEKTIVSARNKLLRECDAVRHLTQMEVDEPGGTRACGVQLVGRPIARTGGRNNALEYEVQLRAPDPRKYSLGPSTSGTFLPSMSGGRTYPLTYPRVYGVVGSGGIAAFENSGTYDSPGKIRIYGPITNPSIEHLELGVTMSFNVVIDQGDFLEIDLDARTILLNGSISRRSAMSNQSRWFTFQPATNTLRFNGSQHILPRGPLAGVMNLVAYNPSSELEDYVVLRTNLETRPSSEGAPYFNAGKTDSNYEHIEGDALFGSKYARATNSSFPSPAFSESETLDDYLVVAPGEVYTYSGYVRTYATRSMRVGLAFLDATGAAYIGGSPIYGSSVSVAAGTWTRLSATVTVPAGTTKMLRFVGPTNAAGPGEKYDWDGFLLEEGNILTSYFDGDTADVDGLVYRWDDTPHDSYSEEVRPSPRYRSSTGGTVYNSSEFPYSGSRFSRLISSNGVFNGAYIRPFTVGHAPIVEPGKTYTLVYVVRSAKADTVTIQWYDSAKTSISASPRQTQATPTGVNTWGIRSYTVTVPTNAMYAEWRIGLADPAAGDKFDLDGVMLVEGEHPAEYFDGDNTDAYWTGTAHDSTSYRPASGEITAPRLEITARSAWIE